MFLVFMESNKFTFGPGFQFEVVPKAREGKDGTKRAQPGSRPGFKG